MHYAVLFEPTREGESLPDGVRVEEITQTGARLSYRGSQFALGGN